MIDWLYISILVLGAILLIIQEMTIRAKEKLIRRQSELLVRMEPILAAIVMAQQEAMRNGEGTAKVELPKVH